VYTTAVYYDEIKDYYYLHNVVGWAVNLVQCWYLITSINENDNQSEKKYKLVPNVKILLFDLKEKSALILNFLRKINMRV